MDLFIVVPLYDADYDRCIGQVPYTSNLDQWDGHDYTDGFCGCHLGVGKTRAGQFYFVHGNQWAGARDTALICTEEEARSAVMSAGKEDLYKRLFGAPIPDLA